MRILYIGYWGANEGLSQATINPHLEILAGFDEVEEIIYVSVERDQEDKYVIPDLRKVKHLPFYSKNFSINFLSKLGDLFLLRRKLFRIISKYAIDLIICRSSLAGVFGMMINKKFGTKLVVESFEPHADYMLNLGIWKAWGVSYLALKHWENVQKKRASWILPVSNKFTKELRNEHINARLKTMPCCVDLLKFSFDQNSRQNIRRHLGISEKATVGIYVGKFGGIYQDHQAFELFKSCFTHISNFHLIILGVTRNSILDQIHVFQLPESQIYVDIIPHAEVPRYLSASDFAYSLHKSTATSAYLSPIKNGEYWANGLPILISEGIGDDSDIIRESGLGIIIEESDSDRIKVFSDLEEMLQKGADKSAIVSLADNYRNFKQVESVYRIILNQ